MEYMQIIVNNNVYTKLIKKCRSFRSLVFGMRILLWFLGLLRKVYTRPIWDRSGKYMWSRCALLYNILWKSASSFVSMAKQISSSCRLCGATTAEYMWSEPQLWSGFRFPSFSSSSFLFLLSSFAPSPTAVAFTDLARSANLPTGLYILLALIYCFLFFF